MKSPGAIDIYFQYILKTTYVLESYDKPVCIVPTKHAQTADGQQDPAISHRSRHVANLSYSMKQNLCNNNVEPIYLAQAPSTPWAPHPPPQQPKDRLLDPSIPPPIATHRTCRSLQDSPSQSHSKHQHHLEKKRRPPNMPAPHRSSISISDVQSQGRVTFP